MKFNRIPSVLILMLLTLSIGVFSEVSEEQKKLLESLPPDQRTTVMNKMEAANALEEDLEETFENPQNLIERPNYEDLANLKRDLESECDDCIFGYDFFKYAPTTFAPINNIPVSFRLYFGSW